MYCYTLLASDDAFGQQYRTWKEKGLSSVAMDFEGEFNLHVYGEHLCLIQLFDGETYFIADPFKISKDTLAPFFTDKDLEKVMFAADGDASLVRKVYGIQMERIWDIRVQALALGYKGNLSGLMEMYGLEHPLEDKKKNQMTNWMRRPLDEHQVQYALGDVAQLLALKKILSVKVEEKKLTKQVARQMKVCAIAKHPDRPGWTKLPGYLRMSPVEQAYAKQLYEARDEVARRRNVPASKVLDKHLLADLARSCAKNPEAWRGRVHDGELLSSIGAKLTDLSLPPR